MEQFDKTESDLPVKNFCLICCNEIDPLMKELNPPSVLDDIFFVLSNYMKWNEAGNLFQFQFELFPFCNSCLPTIESVFELNEQVHNLLRRIDQLCANVSGDILLSRSKCEKILRRNSELRNKNSQDNEGDNSSTETCHFDAQKVYSYRDVIYKRFAPSVHVTPLQKSVSEEYTNKWDLEDEAVSLEMEDSANEGVLGLSEDEELSMEWPGLNTEYIMNSSDGSSNVNVKVETFDECFEASENFVAESNEDGGVASRSDTGKNSPIAWDITERVRKINDVHFIFDEKYLFEKVKNGWKCGTCQQVYKNKTNLDSHLLATCSGAKIPVRNPFVKISPNVYMYAEMFKVVKTGDDKYECSTCSSEFLSRRRILRHMRLHFNENKFTCGICGRGFARRYVRDDHQRMHTNEKPLLCIHGCGRRYSSKKGLSNHLRKNSCKPMENNTCDPSITVEQQHGICDESELGNTFSPIEEKDVRNYRVLHDAWNSDVPIIADEAHQDVKVEFAEVGFDSNSYMPKLTDSKVDVNCEYIAQPYVSTFEQSDKCISNEGVRIDVNECASDGANTLNSSLQTVVSSHLWKVFDGVIPVDGEENSCERFSHGKNDKDDLFGCGTTGTWDTSKQEMDMQLVSSSSSPGSGRRKGYGSRSNFREISPGIYLYENKYKAMKTGEDQYKCLETNCNSVLSRGGIIRHLFYHLNATRFSCGKCGKVFSRKNRFDQHQRRHFNSKFVECQYCGLEFLNVTILKMHLKEEHNETS